MEDSTGGKEVALKIKKPALIATLVILLAFFIMELQVTMNSPIVFGDEGFHAEMAVWMANKLDYPKWVPFEITPKMMTGYWRPPLWNTLQASFLLFSGMSETSLKIMPPLISLFMGLAVYLLVKRLYGPNTAMLASIISVALPSMVTYATLMYYSMLFVFFFTLFFFTFILSEKLGSRKYLYLSWIFAFLSLMTNQVGIGAYVIVFVMFFYQIFKDSKVKPALHKYGPLFIILILLMVPYIVRNLALYGAPTCFTIPIVNRYYSTWDVSGCNVNSLGSQLSFAGQAIPTGTEQTVINLGILNYLDFVYGSNFMINVFIFSVIGGLIILFINKDKNILPFSLVLVMIVGLFVSSSERAEDLSRYTLSFAPMLALVAGIFWNELYDFAIKYQKYLGIAVAAISLVLAFVTYGPSYVVTFVYVVLAVLSLILVVSDKNRKYHKYLALLIFVSIILLSYSNLAQKLPVMKSIKQFSPAFFEACDWIKEHTPENATFYTVWGHNAVYNCKRNMATNMPDVLLAPNLSYELQTLEENDINYIFVQKFSIDPQNRGYAGNYPLSFLVMLESNSQNFEKVYENGPELNQCLQQGGCDGTIVYKVNVS